MRKTVIIVFLCVATWMLLACDLFTPEVDSVNLKSLSKPMDEIEGPKIKHREWSILVYMAADNDLEAAALEDIAEMEVSRMNTDEVSVFILLDRSKAYDASNGNWDGTKFYKLKTNKSRAIKNLISEEISCLDLGLTKDANIELDMSSGYTLSKALSFIKSQYPADQLGLIMWGHGTGWRSSVNEFEKYKGFAYDDSTDSYMTLKQFGTSIDSGLNGEKLDFLGLDTCFGGEIEVMYELRNKAKFAVGTEGLLLLSGWNYEKIFNKFGDAKEKTPINLVNFCIDAFKSEYDLSINASIVGVDLAKIENYFAAFETTMKCIADKVKTKDIRDLLFNTLIDDNNLLSTKYSFNKPNSDVYLDISGIFNTSLTIFPGEKDLIDNINCFNNLKKACLFNVWNTNNNEGGLGVFFGSLTAGNLISSVHDKNYIKSKTIEQIDFVAKSNAYVPGQKYKDSFLDKLFYKEY